MLGLPVSSLSDSVDRRTTLVLADASRLAILVGAVVMAMGGPTLPILALAAFLLGATATLRNAGQQGILAEVAGPGGASTAFALSQMLQRLFGAAGALLAGLLLAGYGGAMTFATASAFVLVGLVVLAGLPRRHLPVTCGQATARPGTALALLRRKRTVLSLFIVVMAIELLGFSHSTALAPLVDRALRAGPDALGILTATAAVGGMMGLAVVAVVGPRLEPATQLAGAVLVFGVGLIVLGLAPSLGSAIVSICIVGSAAGSVDALAQVSLQRQVDDRERGAAAGVWQFAVGIGVTGYLLVGFLVDAVGPATGLILQGTVLTVIGLVAVRWIRGRQRLAPTVSSTETTAHRE